MEPLAGGGLINSNSLRGKIAIPTPALRLLQEPSCPSWPWRLSLRVPRALASPAWASDTIQKSCLPQSHSPEHPKGSPLLPTPCRGFSCPCSGTDPRGLWQEGHRQLCSLQGGPTGDSGTQLRKIPWKTQSDFAEGGFWRGMVVQRKVRCWLLLGVFYLIYLSPFHTTNQPTKIHQNPPVFWMLTTFLPAHVWCL